jgi:hypothetical protein
MSEDRKIVKKVFGDVADEFGRVPGGPALIYLIRRFGYTGWGSDAHKEVCTYYLPTDMEELSVDISIKGKHAWVKSSMADEGTDSLYWKYQMELGRPYQEWHDRCRDWVASTGRSFSGKVISTDEDKALRREYEAIEPSPPLYIEPEPGSIRHQVYTALEAALRDLLRPVFVRSAPINLLGPVKDEGLLGEWLEDEERYTNCVDPHWSAGKGMELEPYRDHALFLDFLDATRERGGGDLFAGMKLALVGTQYERPLPAPAKTSHTGDPCRKCGVAHDAVEVGDCPGGAA